MIVVCEKCLKFFFLVDNLPSNFKSKNFGSVLGQFDGLPTSEQIFRNFF